MLNLLTYPLSGHPVEFVLRPQILLGSLAVSFVIVLLAAFIPAGAAGLNIVEAISTSKTITRRPAARRLLWAIPCRTEYELCGRRSLRCGRRAEQDAIGACGHRVVVRHDHRLLELVHERRRV